MKTERKLKILIINDIAVSDFIERSLNEKFGEQIEVINLEGIRVADWCSPTTPEIRGIVDFAEKTDADLVIIGNNTGAGFDIVMQLPEKMRGKIIIFFAVSAILNHFTKKYREVGITRFFGRIKQIEHEVGELLSK